MISVQEDIGVTSSVLSPLLPKAVIPAITKTSSENKLYVQKNENGDITSFLSFFDGHCVFIKNGKPDYDELAVFLNCKHCISVTATEPEVLENINCSFIKYPLLKKALPSENEMCGEEVHYLSQKASSAVFKELYGLIYNSDLCFDVWYCDVAQRLNKGVLKAVYTVSAGKIVSCAFASACYGNTALISGVVTKEKYKNRGLASRCINSLVNTLMTDGYTDIYLWCENELTAFYSKFGFEYYSDIYVGEYNGIL